METVADLVAQFTDKSTGNLTKKIGISTSSERLLPHFHPKAALHATSFLMSKGVKIYSEQLYNSEFKSKEGYDEVIMTDGLKFNTGFLEGTFKECLTAEGRILVNEHMQLTNIDPETQ